MAITIDRTPVDTWLSKRHAEVDIMTTTAAISAPVGLTMVIGSHPVAVTHDTKTTVTSLIVSQATIARSITVETPITGPATGITAVMATATSS